VIQQRQVFKLTAKARTASRCGRTDIGSKDGVRLGRRWVGSRAARRRRRHDFANEIRMRDDYTDRPKYRLVFCTRSPHGVELMSYFACEYERELFDRHYEGSFDVYWIEQKREAARAAVRDEIHALGVARATMTTHEIVHLLTPLHFGEFLGSEYNEAIREIVDHGGIEADVAKGASRRPSA
jgi:hypothetical protein